MTVYERLHELIDRLSDDDARRLLSFAADAFPVRPESSPAPTEAPGRDRPDDVAARVDEYLRRSQP